MMHLLASTSCRANTSHSPSTKRDIACHSPVCLISSNAGKDYLTLDFRTYRMILPDSTETVCCGDDDVRRESVRKMLNRFFLSLFAVFGSIAYITLTLYSIYVSFLKLFDWSQQLGYSHMACHAICKSTFEHQIWYSSCVIIRCCCVYSL